MKENMVVHFGAGALGRGLVVPLLSESGKQVVLAETNETLLTQFNQNNGYTLHIRDEESRDVFIRILDACSPVKEKNKLLEWLRGGGNCNYICSQRKSEICCSCYL